MQTDLAEFVRDTVEGREAQEILRRCVHCGFCTATCPTYQLLGDELDGPRGRIYQIKRTLEGAPATPRTQLHLDRCLTCRNCESTCPSGVEYGRLVDIGRKLVDNQVKRPLLQRAARWMLKEGLTSRGFGAAIATARALRPILPPAWRRKLPSRQATGVWPAGQHARKVLLLAGCVQPTLAPNIDLATARVLDRLGIECIKPAGAGCCGALRYHLDDHDGGLDDMRRNIDAWWPQIEAGVEAIVMNASGCGAMVKEYGHKLQHDPAYAAKAERVSAMTLDLVEWLPRFGDRLATMVQAPQTGLRIGFHPPCTLQHGQKLHGDVESLMQRLGFDLVLPENSHLCCGSAGTYSILQSGLARELRDRKLASLQAVRLSTICSANIGCITHLQSGTELPVRHWIEVLDEHLR